jgi:hypothetical protein
VSDITSCLARETVLAKLEPPESTHEGRTDSCKSANDGWFLLCKIITATHETMMKVHIHG